jgi:ATPase subunit of ABC transporter with duplicated ATPase domains
MCVSCLCTGLMHERMLCRHDPSYTAYLRSQRERAAAAQQAAQRQREQQARDEEVRREAEARAGPDAKPSEAEQNVMAYKLDSRVGLTIEDCLRYVRDRQFVVVCCVIDTVCDAH